MGWDIPGHTQEGGGGASQLVLLNASCHKKHEHIWFRGGGSVRFPRYLAFYEVNGVGMTGHAMGLLRQCY